MPCLPLSHPALLAASTTHPTSLPIYMLNLWKFRPVAHYAPQHDSLAGAPCTGAEAMARYRAALKPLLPPHTTVFFMGTPIANVVVPEGESWDVVAVIRYETLQGFRDMVESREYREGAEPHRLAGLEDFRLVMVDGEGGK